MKLPYIIVFTLISSFNLYATNIDSLVLNKIKEAKSLKGESEGGGDYKKTVEILEEVLSLAENQSPTDSIMAKLHLNLAISYYYLHKYDIAEKYANRVIELGREEYLDTNEALRFRSNIYLYKGNLKLAIRDIKTAIDLINKNQFISSQRKDSLLATRYHHLGGCYSYLGEVNTSKFYLDLAEKEYLKHYDVKHKYYLTLLIDKAMVYKKLGDYKLYNSILLRIIELANKESAILGRAYHELSTAYYVEGKYEKALVYVQKALPIFKNLGMWVDYQTCQLILMQNYGILGQKSKLEEAYNESIRIGLEVYQTIHHPNIIYAYNRRGRLEEDTENYQAALEFLEKALSANVINLDETDNYDKSIIVNKGMLQGTLFYQARIYWKLYLKHNDEKYLFPALKKLQKFDELSKLMQKELYSQDSKYSFLKEQRKFDEGAIPISLILYRHTKDKYYLYQAYYFNAKNKASVMLESLQQETNIQEAKLPTTVLEEEKQLRQEIRDLEANISAAYQNEGEKKAQILKDSLGARWLVYENFIQQLEQDYPAYYRAKYVLNEFYTPEQIQEQLAPREALIEYFVGLEDIYTFVITKDIISYYEQALPDDFEEVSQGFQKSTSGNIDDSLRTHFVTDAYQLYQWLLEEPLKALSDSIQHLTIIPDGSLTQFSFDALLTKEEVADAYLLNQYTIHYLYSSQFLEQQADTKANPKKLFAGFGIEYDAYTLESIADSTIALQDQAATARAMGKLIYSDDEVRLIAEKLGGKSWLNEAATKAVFLQHAADFKLLHLAMHGEVDMEEPLNSSLIFTRTNDSTDFLLRAADIYNMEIAADMVVLSACNTGTGQIQAGEGIRTLARAFQYAGAKSLVASLWNAPDQATKEIMEIFYKNLTVGMTKDKALQKAKQSYLQSASPEHKHPRYWAHLITVGNVEAIDFGSRSSYWWWGIPILLFLVFGLWKKWKK